MKFQTCFFRIKTTEDDNVKIKVNTNIYCTFLLFKTSAFLQKNFPRKTNFKFYPTR